MTEIKRYLSELHPNRLPRNLQRIWKLYISPPKERSIFLNTESLPIRATLKVRQTTAPEPKQVVVSPQYKIAIVSCMAGRRLQIFDISQHNLELTKEIPFPDQCVEVALDHTQKFAFVTTSNFERLSTQTRNQLSIIDLTKTQIISSIDTGGNWSKVLAIHPNNQTLFISNWHSHDLSVINIENPRSPHLTQLIPWGEAPRGIAFTPKGDKALVTGFYSGNIGELQKDTQDHWQIVFTSPPFDTPHYPGNLRHILINQTGETAYISNLGRNLLHQWSIPERKFTSQILLAKSPNTIAFKDATEKELLVSCRDSQLVLVTDLTNQTIIGKTPTTGLQPTGLASLSKGFLLTTFKDNHLERYEFTYPNSH